MKMQIAVIGANERELELYVGQLTTQGFENVSEVKKAEDGSYYRVMARVSKYELASAKPVVAEAVPLG